MKRITALLITLSITLTTGCQQTKISAEKESITSLSNAVSEESEPQAPLPDKCEISSIKAEDSFTALCFMLLNSRLGFGQFLLINDDNTVTLPEYARPDDIVHLYCSYGG